MRGSLSHRNFSQILRKSLTKPQTPCFSLVPLHMLRVKLLKPIARSIRVFVLATVVAAAQFGGVSIAGESGSGAQMTTRGGAAPPVGFLVFCLKNPSQCRGGGSAQVTLSDEMMATLNSVNRAVNRSIRPRNERADRWEINVRVGDCEDYALTKRARLMALGLPASALRIATARTRSGVGHAVLVVRTNEGDFVLDNLSSRIQVWNQTGLRWIAMSGANPRSWNAV